MKNLENNIKKWREELALSGGISREELDELESHLYDEIDALLEKGLSKEEAFDIAVKRVGNPEDVSEEYRKKRFIPSNGTINYIIFPAFAVLISVLMFFPIIKNLGSYFPPIFGFYSNLSSFDKHTYNPKKLNKLLIDNPNDEEILLGASLLFLVNNESDSMVKYIDILMENVPDNPIYPALVAKTMRMIPDYKFWKKDVIDYTINDSLFSPSEYDSINYFFNLAHELEPGNSSFYPIFPPYIEEHPEVLKLRQKFKFFNTIEKRLDSVNVSLDSLTHYYFKNSYGRYATNILKKKHRENFKNLLYATYFEDYSEKYIDAAMKVASLSGGSLFNTKLELYLFFDRLEKKSDIYKICSFYFRNLGPFENDELYTQTEDELLRYNELVKFSDYPASRVVIDHYEVSYELLLDFYLINGQFDKAKAIPTSYLHAIAAKNKLKLLDRTNSDIFIKAREFFILFHMSLGMLIISILLFIISTIFIIKYNLRDLKINKAHVFVQTLICVFIFIISFAVVRLVKTDTHIKGLFTVFTYRIIPILLCITYLYFKRNKKNKFFFIIPISITVFFTLLGVIRLLLMFSRGSLTFFVSFVIYYMPIIIVLVISLTLAINHDKEFKSFWNYAIFIFSFFIILLSIINLNLYLYTGKYISNFMKTKTFSTYCFMETPKFKNEHALKDSIPLLEIAPGEYSPVTEKYMNRLDSYLEKKGQEPIDWQKMGININKSGDNEKSGE